MGVILLTGFIFGVVAFFLAYALNDNSQVKWALGIASAFVGLLLGVFFSLMVGEVITKKYLASHRDSELVVLKTTNLLPFLHDNRSDRVYMITGENPGGKKVVLYLQDNKRLVEENYDLVFNRNIVLSSKGNAPAKQLIKIDVNGFWRWFAIIQSGYRFVIPPGGLQEGF